MYYSKMLYSLFLLVIKTSTESFWSRKEKQRLFDGRLAVACLSCGKLGLIPSKHRDIQHIHSVQHILDGVHSIHHREEQGQLQAWPQHHAFHNIHSVHKCRDIHSVWHILDDVHNILHTEEQGQLQPWPLAQPHAFHNIRSVHKDIHSVQHIPDDVHNILHIEEQDLLQHWLLVQLHACQDNVHIYKDIHIHILDDVHNNLHKGELDQLQPWAQPLHRQQLPDRQWR